MAGPQEPFRLLKIAAPAMGLANHRDLENLKEILEARS